MVRGLVCDVFLFYTSVIQHQPKRRRKKKATDGCCPTSHVTLASHRELKIFSRMGGSYEAVKRLTLPHKFPNLYMAIFVAVCVCVCRLRAVRIITEPVSLFSDGLPGATMCLVCTLYICRSGLVRCHIWRAVTSLTSHSSHSQRVQQARRAPWKRRLRLNSGLLTATRSDWIGTVKGGCRVFWSNCSSSKISR